MIFRHLERAPARGAVREWGAAPLAPDASCPAPRPAEPRTPGSSTTRCCSGENRAPSASSDWGSEPPVGCRMVTS